MQSLDEKEWKPCVIQEIFSISPGKRLESRNRNPGRRPFIGALDNSNGIVQFVSDTNESLDCNVLGVNYNGNGMGIGFYHPYECVFSDDVKRFHLKNTEDCEELALFTKALIAKQRDKFGYLYKFNAKRMAATSIVLPVDDTGEPDYEYMAEYTRQKREAKLSKCRIYIEERIAELGELLEIPSLDEKKWAGFVIEDLFNVMGTVTTHPSALIANGNTPRVTCAATNNGFDNCYGNSPTESGHVLTVDSAVLGTVFYQPFAFIATDHVEKIDFIDGSMNLYVGLFLQQCITKAIDSKYQYGYKFSQKRIKRQKLMLPVNDAGEPDYAYMEQYAKNMMLRKYRQYLAFLERDAEE